MPLTLIYLSVIMLQSYVIGSKVKDLSDVCTQGRVYNNYMTYGVENDGDVVAMLTTANSYNCVLRFSIKIKNYIMVVLQFPELKKGDKVCVSKEAQNNSVILSDYSAGKDCQYTGSTLAYRSLALEKTAIELQGSQDIGTIKITVTSMRGTDDSQCIRSNETECVISNQAYCMTKKVSCDGNINCGVKDVYDEDIALCTGRSLTFFMKICTTLMGMLTIFLFGSICMTLMPRRKEPFVNATDESASIFDSESEIFLTEIDVHILFSNYVDNRTH